MHSSDKIQRHTRLTAALLIVCISTAFISPQAVAKSSRKAARAAALAQQQEQQRASRASSSLANPAEECDDEDQLIGSRLTVDTKPASVAQYTRGNRVDGNASRTPLPQAAEQAIVASKQKTAAVQARNGVPATQSDPRQAALPLTAAATPSVASPASPALALSPLLASLPGTFWEIALTDKTLNATLARWTASAGWQLLWELPVDYAVEAKTMVPGSFEEAVETVARSMETAEIPMKAIFYKGNRVLRIVPAGVK